MLNFYTSQYRCKDCDRLDITVKNPEGSIFAPTWEMVMKSKSGLLTHQEYTDLYLQRMADSYHKWKQDWDDLLAKDRIVLVCFCPSGTFCHRYILADILVKLGAKYGGEIDPKTGEIMTLDLESILKL